MVLEIGGMHGFLVNKRIKYLIFLKTKIKYVKKIK